jgi:four helix bundle protein
MPHLRHHSLVAWQRADDLYIHIHTLTRDVFPGSERFELSSQLRRAAYSVPANIAEGFARRHWRQRRYFLNIAESSLAEVAYGLHAARRLGYITDAVYSELEIELNRVGAPLVGLIRSMRIASVATTTLVTMAIAWLAASL